MATRRRPARNLRCLVSASTVLLLIGTLLSLAGCSSDPDDGILSGNLSKASGSFDDGVNRACYVFLDTDTDITNGYTKRVIIDITAAVASLSYEIDTSDVAAGSYFLLGAYDFEDIPDDNMDPDDPSVWEAKGWWGSADENPPAAANVTNLSSTYNLVVHALP